MKLPYTVLYVSTLMALSGTLSAINVYEGFDYPFGEDVNALNPDNSIPNTQVYLGEANGGIGWNTVEKADGVFDPNVNPADAKDDPAWADFPLHRRDEPAGWPAIDSVSVSGAQFDVNITDTSIAGRRNMSYSLEKDTSTLQDFNSSSNPLGDVWTGGTGGAMVLSDAASVEAARFYKVRSTLIHQGVKNPSDEMYVIENSLTPPVNYGFTPIGNSVKGGSILKIGKNTGAAYRELDPANYIDMNGGAPVYFSFLIMNDNIELGENASYGYFRMLEASRKRVLDIGIGRALDTATIALWDTADGTFETQTDTVIATGEVMTPLTSYLIVGKITRSGASSSIDFSVYASSESIPVSETWEVSTAVDLADIVIDRIGIFSGGYTNTDGANFSLSRRTTFDEIRFGDTWASVTGL